MICFVSEVDLRDLPAKRRTGEERVGARQAAPELLSDRKHWQKPPTASGFVHKNWSVRVVLNRRGGPALLQNL